MWDNMHQFVRLSRDPETRHKSRHFYIRNYGENVVSEMSIMLYSVEMSVKMQKIVKNT